MRDIVWITLAFVIVIAAFLAVGLVAFAIFFAGVGTTLACVEYYLWATKRETLSSQFWRFRREHRAAAEILLFLLAFIFALLLLHLRQ